MAFQYDDETKKAALRQLAANSIRTVSKVTGIGEGTLRGWAKENGITVPDGRTPKPKAEANGSSKKRRRGKRRSRSTEVIDTLPPPSQVQLQPEVAVTLQTALADIERAGKSIRAIQAAARRVFGS